MSSTEQQEFRNEKYTVQIEKEPGCQIKMHVEVSPQATDECYRSAIKVINKEVTLPGFRKGKAPAEFIMQQFPSAVEREWKEQLLQTSFNEAVKIVNLYPYTQESIQNAKVNSFSQKEGSSLSYAFEAQPDVPEIDMSDISIPEVQPDPVTEEKCNQIIEDIRYQLATWEEITGRAVEEGDFVDLDINFLDHSEEEGLKDTRVEVTKGKIGTWLHQLLIGMHVNESKEALSEQEPGKENPKFIPTRCRIVLKSIHKSVLPAIDDELAKKAGAQSLQEMKERIAKDMEKVNFQQAQEKRRESLKKAVLSKYAFDVPDTLVRKAAHQMINARIAELKESGDESLLSASALEEMEKEVFDVVRNHFRWQFISSQVANKENIRVSQQAIISEIIQRKYADPSAMRNTEKTEEDLFNEAMVRLMSAAVADFLIEKMPQVEKS